MAFTYTQLLSGSIAKKYDDGRVTVMPAQVGNPYYDAYLVWKDAGGVPLQEALPTNQELIAALHKENYQLAKAKFESLSGDYHGLEALEWQKLETECIAFQANPDPDLMGPTMRGEIDTAAAMGCVCDPAHLAQRVITKATELRIARFAIIAKRNKNRQEIDALSVYAQIIAHEVNFDGLGF